MTGEYSWVDPDGALHLVRYKADETGFHVTETLKQPGFVKIVPKVRTSAPASRAAAVGAAFTAPAARPAAVAPTRKLVKKVRVLRPNAGTADLPVVGLAARPTAAPPVRAAPLPTVASVPIPTVAATAPVLLASPPTALPAPFVSLTPFRPAAAALQSSFVPSAPVPLPAVRPQLLLQRFVPSAVVPAAIATAAPSAALPAAAPLQSARDAKQLQLFGSSGETVVKFNAPSYNYEY